MKHLCITLSTFLLLGLSSIAQTTLNEREYLLSNYISDIGVCSYCCEESFSQGSNVVFQTGVIEVSPMYTLKRRVMSHENDNNDDSIEYHIQFYKIQGNNWVNNLYVIHLVDNISRNIDVWLRVRGWRENDMRFLYLMYKNNGLKKRDFKNMVLSWIPVDSIAREIQIDKILQGAIRNKMDEACFISEHYKLLDGLRQRDIGVLDKKCLYSVFSRQPMDGMWLEF